MLTPETGLQRLLHHDREPHPATPTRRPLGVMFGALPGQDLFSNFIEMLLDMKTPESLRDGSAVLGANVQQRQARLAT